MSTAPRVILHTESSVGFGGQEIRVLGEARWLLAHGWSALIACQPGSRLFGEARAAGLPVAAMSMRSALDLPAFEAKAELVRAVVQMERRRARILSRLLRCGLGHVSQN